jgi:hypothetical protein
VTNFTVCPFEYENPLSLIVAWHPVKSIKRQHVDSIFT